MKDLKQKIKKLEDCLEQISNNPKITAHWLVNQAEEELHLAYTDFIDEAKNLADKRHQLAAQLKNSNGLPHLQARSFVRRITMQIEQVERQEKKYIS